MSDVTFYIHADWSSHCALERFLKEKTFEPEPIYRRTDGARNEGPYIGFLRNFLQVTVPQSQVPAVQAVLHEAEGRLWVHYTSTDWKDFQANTPAPDYESGVKGRIPQPDRRYGQYIQGEVRCGCGS